MAILTIIILAAERAAENAWMKANIDRRGGERSFIAPLTSDGQSITHYWFSNQWSNDAITALQDHYGDSAYTGTPQEALDAAGLRRYTQDLT